MSTAVIGAPGFRARSGRLVQVRENGTVTFDHANGYLSPETAMDAEEFFQAQRDIELGRWRWPENPDYVVYRDTSGDAIVFREQMPVGGILYRRGDDVVDMESEAARAYFEAHQERKPWDDAKSDEVWVLTWVGQETGCAARLGLPQDMFMVIGGGVVRREDVTSGRRIWPEDAS